MPQSAPEVATNGKGRAAKTRCRTRTRPIKCKLDEVALGYEEATALDEAERCLNCPKKPCVSGCPVNIDIPAFINLIKEKDYTGAAKELKKTNALPAVCGRVCPQEDQCKSCACWARRVNP